MKLRTVGLLFSLVCAITLGSAKGNAVANEMKATKNEITAVVKDAVKEQMDFSAMDFTKHGKEEDRDEDLEDLYEIFEKRSISICSMTLRKIRLTMTQSY